MKKKIAAKKKTVKKVSKPRVVKTVKVAAVSREVSPTIIKEVTTGIDELYSLVKTKKKVSSSEAVKHCKVSKEKIEEWSNALHDAGLVEVSYSLLGNLVIRKKD